MSLHNPGTRHLPARKHSQGPHRPHPIGLVNGQQASIAMFTEFAGMLADITSRCTALTVVGPGHLDQRHAAARSEGAATVGDLEMATAGSGPNNRSQAVREQSRD